METIKIKPAAEFASLTPGEQLIKMGFEYSESYDRRGKKFAVYSKDGVDYRFRGRIPQTGEIELFIID